MSFKVITPDKNQLHEFISGNKYNVIFQSEHILDIYKNVPKCVPICLAALNEKDTIVATLVGVQFQEKGSLFKYVSSHSTVRGGPIFVDNKEGKKAASLLISKFIGEVRSKSLYSRIFPMNEIEYSDLLAENGYLLEGESNIYIDLKKSEEDLWKQMHKMKRKAVSKAQKNNVSVIDVHDEFELVQFYHLLEETYRKNKLELRDFRLFQNIFYELVPKGLAKIVLACYNDKPIAGRLVLTYNGRIYDWYAGSDSSYLNLRPNDLLVWSIISWGANNGYEIFDFGGAGNPNEEYTVRDFKLKFGGELKNYGKFTRVIKPNTLKICKSLYNYYQRFNFR